MAVISDAQYATSQNLAQITKENVLILDSGFPVLLYKIKENGQM